MNNYKDAYVVLVNQFVKLVYQINITSIQELSSASVL